LVRYCNCWLIRLISITIFSSLKHNSSKLFFLFFRQFRMPFWQRLLILALDNGLWFQFRCNQTIIILGVRWSKWAQSAIEDWLLKEGTRLKARYFSWSLFNKLYLNSTIKKLTNIRFTFESIVNSMALLFNDSSFEIMVRTII
jgi:hypothetical protein